MKEGAAEESGFSGGETATPRLLNNQQQKPQLASTFHRCPKESYAEPTQINHPLRTSPKTFSELFHILGTHVTTSTAVIATTEWLSGVYPAWHKWIGILMKLMKIPPIHPTHASPPNPFTSDVGVPFEIKKVGGGTCVGQMPGGSSLNNQ